ncbi:MAG: S9 family peptidase [Acidobacteriota bacterium]|nr:S9 family peptidase [Blastocatellia bacterium]MDW8411888.1 S9 family peptidase [Acidobacteriota bacterium]
MKTILVPLLVVSSIVPQQLTPPVAKKVPKITVIHGEELIDDYSWLREKSNPEVISYLEAENAYADAMMQHTQELQRKLYEEMLGRIKETDLSVPYLADGYYYYTRTEKGKQYSIYCRKKGNLDASEEIILDVNELASGKPYTSIGMLAVSDDGNLLAFSTDYTGFRQYTLRIKDLRTGKLLPDIVENAVDFAWASDSKTIFYTIEDAAKRPYRIYRHVLGTAPQQDVLVYEEKDELYRTSLSRTRSKQYILITSASSTTSEVHYISSNKPSDPATLLLKRKEGHEYYVEHQDNYFYIRTNDSGKNFRLVRAPITDTSVDKWTEVVPHRKEVMLEDIDCFASHIVLWEREQGIQKIRVIDTKTGQTKYVKFPEPVYAVFSGPTPEYKSQTLRYTYQSFTTPASVYDYDINADKSILLKRTEVLGGYDPQNYRSERIYATASDGTKIPISLVYRKDKRTACRQPLLLNGYGSYGISRPVSFSSERLSLLDRGVIFAIAHIRGGGDLGKDWHDQGKMMVKKNTFTDFIACAEHLIAEGYTAPDKLVITGGSAGGLLMGAVVNMRPELFRAVVSYVPFVDVINTMLDPSLPLTVQEYLEWGNPNDKEAYLYIKSYSPYDNLERKAYPSMLIRTSLNDSQVMYWEPAKYVAKLRSLKTDKNLLLFKTNMAAGHSGASGRYDALRDTAFDYAFILTQLGITK